MRLKIYILILCLVAFRLNAQAQLNNLIYNGDFELWDTAKYSLLDNGDKDLCQLSNGIIQNGYAGIFCLKGINYCKWTYNLFDTSIRYISNGYSIGGFPTAYYNCNPNEMLQSAFCQDLPKKGKTFVSTNFMLDTISFYSARPKVFFYMPLIQKLTKGKLYQLDFDLAAAMSPEPICDWKTADVYGCSGFGFGFTEKPPTFIVKDNVHFETDLKPSVKLGFFDQKKWTSFSRYFVADSNSQYIIFGFFDKGLAQNIYTKQLCQFVNTDPKTKYVTFILDNLFLKQVSTDLLPSDTIICIGKSITIKSIQNKPLKWFINGILQPIATLNQTLIINADVQIIAMDSLVSDTMNIKAVQYPVFSIVQTDTLCNDVTGFSANPNVYTYNWQPDNLQGNSVQINGNNPRMVIASTKEGCKDTIDFTPILSTNTCGSFFIPNTFTPTKDEINDKFGIIGTGIQNVEMQIYNLWGEKVFEGKGENVLWDGYYKNAPCQQGIYIYKIKLTYLSNGKPSIAFLKGTINVLK